MNERLVAPILVLALAAPALAGEKIFHLKNGRQIQGQLVDESSKVYVIRTSGGGTTNLPKDLVKSIEDAPERKPDDGASTPSAPAQPAARNAKAPSPSPSATPPDKGPAGGSSELDMPDENGLVPKFARLGGATSAVEAKEAAPWFRREIEEFLQNTSDPAAIVAWVKEKAGSRPNFEYVERLMVTWSRNPAQRRALWQAWIESQPIETAEGRILPYVTSDLWNARLDACVFIGQYGTWDRSFEPLLKLVGLPHETSAAAAHGALEALIKRQAPSESQVARLIAFNKRATSEPARWWSLRALGDCSATGSRPAALQVRSVYMKAERPEKVNLIEPVLKALDKDESHAFLLQILHDDTPDGRSQWSLAGRILTRFGDFSDLPAVLRLLDQGPDEIDTGLAKISVKAIVLDVVPALAQHARFDSIDDLKAWWQGGVESALANVTTLCRDATEGGASARGAVASLVDVRLPEVDRALRDAATSNSDAGVRAEACRAIAKRRDRKGVPALMAALKRADAATRDSVVFALRSLAQGEAFPTADAQAAEEWWRKRFPDDFSP